LCSEGNTFNNVVKLYNGYFFIPYSKTINEFQIILHSDLFSSILYILYHLKRVWNIIGILFFYSASP